MKSSARAQNLFSTFFILLTRKNDIASLVQGCRNLEKVGDFSPPTFGILLNPIFLLGGDWQIFHTKFVTTNIFEIPASLQYVNVQQSCKMYFGGIPNQNKLLFIQTMVHSEKSLLIILILEESFNGSLIFLQIIFHGVLCRANF